MNFRSKTCLLFMAASFTSCLQTEEVDLVVHNAIIYTVDNLFSTTEAMAIRNDTIVAIGAEREILNKYSAKEKVDAKKRPVFPGFIDAHCHFLGYGLSLQQVDLVGTKSFDEVIERVVEFSKNSKAKWITGRGWDQNDWEVKEFPNKEILDSLFPETPVLIRRIDGHAALANQKALNKANVTIESKINGGIIEMKDDKLTGILIDNAIGLVGKAVPRTNKEQKIKALLDAQQNCFAVGLTTVDDAGMSKSEIELIDQLQKEGKLKMKIYAMLSDTKENFDHYLITGPYKTERLNVRSFKFYADGALGSRGACLLEPYSDIIESEHYGLILNEENHFKNYAQKLLEMGFQMNTHCIGDSANRLILDIYAEVLQGTNDKRWRIEHAQVVHSDDFQKFGKCNIIPSVQPTHATSDMYWAKDRLGPKRVKGAYAFKDLLQQNGILALGTDFPVEGISPFKTFYAAVARMDSNGFPKNGYQMENALSREETLRGMTIGAAITNFEENEKGSLEVGKKADFVILDRDIMKVSIEELLNTKVIATFVNGEKVYGN